jgi:uncharacterized protein (TIGR02646 family)
VKTIRKGPEPIQLTQRRLADHTDYEGFPKLRQQLIKDQRALCCYCLGRIRDEWRGMRIEHWQAQTSNPSERLVYSNLLAACYGSEGSAESHCDVARGSKELSRNPANPDHRIEDLIHYQGNGLMTTSDSKLNEDLETLNLNCAFLQHSRKQTLTALQMALGKRKLKKKELRKLLAIWNGDRDSGELKPYCMIVVYWLKKRLNRV